MRRVTILYEDRRSDDNEFGLHDFVCQCVIDRLNWTTKTVYDVRTSHIQGVPAGGDSKLRRKCQEDLKNLSDRNERVFALYDEDKVARLVNLPGKPCRPLLYAHLALGCEPSEKLEIVLLARNTESVIETIRDSGMTSIQNEVFSEALRKRRNSRGMRDRIFTRCTRELSRDEHSQLLSRLCDIDRLVSKVAAVFEPEVQAE